MIQPIVVRRNVHALYIEYGPWLWDEMLEKEAAAVALLRIKQYVAEAAYNLGCRRMKSEEFGAGFSADRQDVIGFYKPTTRSLLFKQFVLDESPRRANEILWRKFQDV